MWWIYAPFSAVFAAWFLGESLTLKTADGGALIIAGPAVSVWP